MARYFRLPFAVSGDKMVVPDETATTVVSYATGYPEPYELNPETDPLSRRPEREFFNQLQFDITDTLRLYYETGAPPFITSAMNNGAPFPYSVGARVLLNNRSYENTIANNTNTPPAAGWQAIDQAGNDARYFQRGESDLRYFRISNNLSEITSEATARTNLGLGTASTLDTGIGSNNLPTTSQTDARYYTRSLADNTFLNESNNLSDLPSAPTARNNLGLGTAATVNTGTGSTNVPTVAQADTIYLNQASNLSDLPSDSTARTNLGVLSSTESDARYLLESNNLSDLTNTATARTNLELGTAAQANVNQFVYPYSGITGSIEKSDLFTTPATVANQFTVQARTYNINSAFVAIAQTTITLTAAEDTADRAEAWDDLFVLSDGTYSHNRSITPHRTTTGYDADLIAIEHGYTRVSNGLYRSGSNDALLLARIARRNQGAYHPVWNYNGSSGYRSDTGDRGAQPWYSQFVLSDPTSTEDTFSLDNTVLSGNIAGLTSRSVRNPDLLPYDAIYADDITPLYLSAKQVNDRQALLFDNFNRAVAGETFLGAEGTSTMPQLIDLSDYRNSVTAVAQNVDVGTNNVVMNNATGTLFSLPPSVLLVGYSVQISFTVSGFSGSTTRVIVYADGNYDGTILNITADGDYTVFHRVGNFSGDFGNETGIVRFVTSTAVLTTLTITNLRQHFTVNEKSARPQFLSIDIIGALTAFPPEYLTEGIPGNWLAVDEDGESLIPDGTTKNFKMSRKVLELYQVLRTNDMGATWADVTSTYETALEGAGNTLGDQSFTATEAFIVSYRTTANPFELADNSALIAINRLWATQSSFASGGSVFASNLINKIPMDSDGSSLGHTEIFRYDNFRALSTGSSAGKPPFHNDLFFRSSNANQVIVKVLPYISQSSGIAVIQCVYKEIKSNGTSLGDDNQFNIVDNQSTVTDTNGETVIVGQKRTALPYHFDGERF